MEILTRALTVAFFLLAVWSVIRYFSTAFGKRPEFFRPPVYGANTERTPIGRVLLFVLILFLVSRALIWLGGLAGAAKQGDTAGFLLNQEAVWTRWDAPHYLDLIRSWYTDEGEQGLFIVFFPMYPMVCRGLCLLTGMEASVAAYLVSNLAFYFSGVLMYRLSEESGTGADAGKVTALMMLSPLTLFCSVPYTESLFLLTSVFAVLMARRGRFLPSVTAGALCAFTRLCGLAIAIPIFYEMLRRQPVRGLRPVLRSVTAVLPVALGLIAYLFLNYKVTGDPLRFMVHQSEHWGQRFGSLGNTLRYTFSNAAQWPDPGIRYGTWIPQAIALVTALAVMGLAVFRSHPGDSAFALVCFYVSAVPTWLLSGPRYLSAIYAFYPMEATLLRRRALYIPVCILAAAGCFAAGWMYSACGILL